VYEVDQLEVEVERLRRKVDELASNGFEYYEREELLSNVRLLQGQMADLSDVDGRLETVEVHVREARTDLAEIKAAVKSLTGRIEWLTRNVRIAEGIAVYDLDAVDKPVAALADQAEAMRAAKAELLPGFERERLRRMLHHHEKLLAQAKDDATAALTASRQIAATTFDSDPHDDAVETYRIHFTARNTALQERSANVDDVRTARERLAADDALQRSSAATIRTGEQAWAALRVRLRTRIAEALGDGALLPVWFTTVLGFAPPATNTEEWMATATSLLAYRVTYRVNDPVVALGTTPSLEDERHRQWHDQLKRELEDRRR
jgi:chromosome segregation ATPase